MKPVLRILSLEDDHDDFEFITETLDRSGFSVVATRVDKESAFVQAIASFHPDIILSDHALPTFDSTEALIIAKSRVPTVPFILVTGAVSDEFAVKTLKLGADDYVLKSNLNRLPSAIKNALKQKETELAKARAAQELAKRNEELSKINRELDSFVYSVSHNIRAPLMSVLGLVNLAKREEKQETLYQYNTLIEESVMKLDRTLRDILEYSRNARLEVKREQINFHQLVDDTLGKLEFMPGFSDLKKRILITESPIFYSDSYRLSVIFNNMISNAVKYADRTKTRSVIEVNIRNDSKYAAIEFRDNGIGIRADLVPRIFDMFFRATESKEGAGLGLYIVHEAVHMLKGNIEVYSKYGEGTTFKIRIPNLASVGAGVVA